MQTTHQGLAKCSNKMTKRGILTINCGFSKNDKIGKSL